MYLDKQHVFTFDEVFDATDSNEDVYRRAVEPLVEFVANTRYLRPATFDVPLTL